MENASKALVIAGAILVAIILISLGIIVITQARSQISGTNLNSEQVEAFNSKFTSYIGSIDGVTANALVNLCHSNGVTVKDGGSGKNRGTDTWPSYNSGDTLTAQVTGKNDGSTTPEDKGKITEITIK